MMFFYLFILEAVLLSGVQASIPRLSTLTTATLPLRETITSTLGLFTLSLISNQCQLQISQFQAGEYQSVTLLQSSTTKKDCSSLTVRNGQLLTDSNAIFMEVPSGNYATTTLTIDDKGVVRLISTSVDSQGQHSNEKVLNQALGTNSFVFPTTLLAVPKNKTLSSLTNSNAWVFQASKGVVTIQKANMTASATFNQLNVANGQITDQNNIPFPFSSIEGIYLQPRCNQGSYLRFQPPFVFVADPNWPRLSVYEQGRYRMYDIAIWDGEQSGFSSRKEYSPCPQLTFELNGDCVASCPAPYYHEMRGLIGSCVLNCQELTSKNESARTCSCMSSYEAANLLTIINGSCPMNSNPTPYGCACIAPNYFDTVLTLSCVSSCPLKTYGANGLCMSCPRFCETCERDKLSRAYLACVNCNPGYILTDGNCKLQCGSGVAVIKGVCSACSDPHCLSCIQSKDICTICSPLYSLSLSGCTLSCPMSSQLAISGLHSQCLLKDSSCAFSVSSSYNDAAFLQCDICPTGQFIYLNTCVAACPVGYSANVKGYCVCMSGLTIGNQCVNMTGCPIKTFYDIPSQSCLKCPFACLSCLASTCTSCTTNYFLLISPQGVICRKVSPLVVCSGDYTMIAGTCQMISSASLGTHSMNLCLSSVTHCKVCAPGNSNSCAACETGFYLYNNLCSPNCPAGTFSYNSVCLVNNINQCARPYLRTSSHTTQATYSTIFTSQSYGEYNYAGLDEADDPSPYFSLFSKLSQGSSNDILRTTHLQDSSLICLQCAAGSGLSSDYSSCQPCPSPCLTCHMANAFSCSSYKPTLCTAFTNERTGLCQIGCSPSEASRLIGDTLYCVPFDSTHPVSYLHVDSSVFTSKDGSQVVHFIFSANVSQKTPTAVQLLTVSASQSLPTTQSLYNQQSLSMCQAQKQDGFILNFTGQLKSLASLNGETFPNSAYGVVNKQAHNDYMTGWLAAVGLCIGVGLVLLKVIYVGNGFIYKMDNAVILAQTVYFFMLVKLLLGQVLAQFYYGWFAAHFAFFSFFTVPSCYYENDVPNSFKLATSDANFIRNAGPSLSLLICLAAILILAALVTYTIKKFTRFQAVWRPTLLTSAACSSVQFVSMSIMFWSVAHLLYRGQPSISTSFTQLSTTISVMFIVGYTIYAFARLKCNHLGGLYTFKRLLLAATLAPAFQNTSFLVPLLLIETVFLMGRYMIEQPNRLEDKVMLVAEWLVSIGCYSLMFLSVYAAVVCICVSLVVFLFMVVLALDLVGVYLESRNEWEVENPTEKQQIKQKISHLEITAKGRLLA